MPTGTVKWFNNAKGYGFILPDEGGEDLFVHYSSILMDGYKTLKAGQPVSFEVVKGGKGLHATNIKTTENPAEPPRSGTDNPPENHSPGSDGAAATDPATSNSSEVESLS